MYGDIKSIFRKILNERDCISNCIFIYNNMNPQRFQLDQIK